MIIPNINKQSCFFPYLLICLFIIIPYLPSFSGEFILDDIPLIKENQYLREWHSFSSYLSQEDGIDKDSVGHTGYYRPIVNPSYTLDYKIWGMLAPGFKLTNLILHLLTSFSLYIFYTLIFDNKKIALMLVLIFSLHPVNTETVSWATSRNNILVTFFSSVSLIFYIRSYANRRYYEYILSVLFFTFSVFSKEFGLMLLPIFFLYLRIFKNGKKITFAEMKGYIPFIVVACIYFFFRQNAIGAYITHAGFSDVFTRIYNVPYIFFLNLKLVFFPFNLHSFIIRYPENLFNLPSLICLLCFLILIVLLWIYRKNKIVIFSILTFFLAMVPVLGVIQTSATSLISMRWLYFSLPFILLILSLPIKKFVEFNNKLTIVLFTCGIFYLGINSYTLNRFLWHSQNDLYKQEVLHFNNYFYSSGLAFIYRQENKPELAMKLYEKSIEEDIRLDINYIGYAELLFEKGDLKNSLEYLEKAEALPIDSKKLGWILHYKGLIYSRLKKYEEAKENLLNAINLSPDEPVYWENLGIVYGEMGNHLDALHAFKKAIKLGGNSTSLYINIAVGYISINECEKARNLINKIKKNSSDAVFKRLSEEVEKCQTQNNPI